MAARLPVVGSDNNSWGTVLNTFLQAGHNAVGTNIGTMSVFNVKDDVYGAKGDGTTDDSAAIAACLLAASATGGMAYFPPGTYISGNQTLYANVYILGAGVGVSIIKLKNGSNTDLFSAQTGNINLAASFLSGSGGTLLNFGMAHLTLDGNKAGQSGGPSYPLRFYGVNYLFEDMVILNGYSGGVLCDWNGGTFPTNSIESRWRDIKIGYCNGIGFEMGGPHDSQISGIIPFCNQSHGFHIGPNAGGLQASDCHAWSGLSGVGMSYDNSAVGWLVECSIRAIDCVGESYINTQVALIGSVVSSWVAGDMFTNTSTAPHAMGLQLGQKPTFGSDTFATRTVSNAFGTGSDGQTWNFISGNTTNLSVGTNEGTIAASGNTQILTYGSKVIADADVTVKYSFVSSTAEVDFLCLILRYIDANNYYLMCSSQDKIYIHKNVGGVGTDIGSAAKTLTGGTFYHLRGRVQGSSLQLRFWQDGTSEPSTWDISITDTDISGHGQYGILAFAGSGIKIDHYVLSQLAYKNSVYQDAAGLATVQSCTYSLIDTIIYNCNAGSLWAVNESNNQIRLQDSNTGGGAYIPMALASSDTRIDNSQAAFPGPVQVSSAGTLYSGSGAPAGGTGAIGDYYFRIDTPSTANQRIYVKTAASTWTGIV